MIYASRERGGITLAMLFGHQDPIGYDRRTGSSPSKYRYPPALNRKERVALRQQYELQYLREEGPAKCAEIGIEFDIRPEAAYKDLMQLKAKGFARITPCAGPALWEAV